MPRPADPRPVEQSRRLDKAPDAPPPATGFTRHPGGARIVAIGDLHGDLQAARAALRLAGAVDASDRWTGEQLVVVQTGDQLDRGDDEREIVDLFDRLEGEAKAQGGAVIALNGNHETMNVQGDFRYVTPEGLQDFHGVAPRSPLSAAADQAARERASAFLPGGAYAMKLAGRDVIAIVKDSVFAHGGVLPQHVEYGVDRLNQAVRAWMAGKQPVDPALVAGDSAPVWTRAYGGDKPGADVCGVLDRVLGALSARRLVVGHTVQKDGITEACGGKLYRIDVGMSRYYGGNRIQVLEITDAGTRVRSGTRSSLLGDPARQGSTAGTE